ncbi:MAG: hypothetical protein RIB84_22415 [Sneathiellaceae bacterium]
MSAATALRPAEAPAPLTVAIASKASLRPAWQQLVGALKHKGWPVQVISNWVHELPGPASNWNEEWRASIDEAGRGDLLIARVCVDDRADVVIAQVGAALGAGKRVAILGTHPLLDRLGADPLVDFWVPGAGLEAVEDALRTRRMLP